MTLQNYKDAQDYLQKLASMQDDDIHLGRAAISLSLSNSPELSLGRFEAHMTRMADDLLAAHGALIDAGAANDVSTMAAAIKQTFVEKYGYGGDKDRYDNLDNADLIQVIEQRKGLPIALSILYMSVIRTVGWNVEGLNFPAHFIIRLERDGERLILDPFNDCAVLGAPELRQILKEIAGDRAELSASYYQPAKNREILIRLQNNIKHRQIEAEDYEGALATVEKMALVDPDEIRLNLDRGVLLARLACPDAAIDALQIYADRTDNPGERRDALLLIQQIQQALNQG